MNHRLKISAMIIVILFVVYAALSAILAVLEVITWDNFNDWILKFGLVALIVLAAALLIGWVSQNPGDKK